MIDRVAKTSGRRLVEVPVGFKWFVDGLLDGSLGFGGEESAGASFLRRDGTVWTTDKDGIILDLLAARSPRRPAATRRALPRSSRSASARPSTSASTRRPRRSRRPRSAALSPEAVRRDRRSPASRSSPSSRTRARQRRADRRPQGRDRERLVRGAAVRHRGRLQDLRGELPRRSTSRSARTRSSASTASSYRSSSSSA
jgi:hypothetical protein